MKPCARISTDDYETARLLAERAHRRVMNDAGGLGPIRLSRGARLVLIWGGLLLLCFIITLFGIIGVR